MSDPATRLSRNLSQGLDALPEHCDALVVGSGYGAGVAVNRLARMGLDVVLLERGKERVPGEFPDTLRAATSEFQLHAGARSIGANDALFDMRVHDDVSVLVGCGLGGTSLINGNVMLRPEPKVFADPRWPRALREDLEALDSAYATAAQMLESTPYPDTVALPKLIALRQQAAALDAQVSLPPLNVTFDALTGDTVGARQPACTLCGDCCSGCNVGAKNTVAMNYLPDAVAHGARLVTGAKVSWVARYGDGWRVYVLDGDPGNERSIDCEHVFLGAGTLGSTEILLRSADRGLAVSSRIGSGFSGNGDVIAFGYNNDVAVNGIGTADREIDVPAVGPVIAGLVDLRREADVARNIVIQEGALPSALAALLPAMLGGAAPLFGADTDPGDTLQEAGRTLTSLARGAYRGAVHHTQTFLVMAHEASQGRMELRGGRLDLLWPDAGRDPVFEHISAMLERATAATGGTYLANPIWSEALGRNLVSVHPLGGVPMGDSIDSGVVDDRGRVFERDDQVHRGLHVLDGSVVPRSLGVNPSLTITALAERALAAFARERLSS